MSDYTVQFNDTLATIAARTGAPLSELQRAYPLIDVHKPLPQGKVLNVPGWDGRSVYDGPKATRGPDLTGRVDDKREAPAGGQLSPIGQKIVNNLKANEPSAKGKNWDVSYGNRLEGNWLAATPSKDNSAILYKDVYNVISKAKSSVTISTLSEPDNKYQDVISRSIKELHDKLPAGSLGVDVRILVGQISGKTPQNVLDDLTVGLPDDSKVRVTVATYGDEVSHNHSKILSRDGEEAVVGGHNWWASDYNLSSSPVNDVSIRVKGDAARHAENYFQQLWDYAAKTPGNMASKGALAGPLPKSQKQDAPPGTPGTPIISIGTKGGTYFVDGTSDQAIYAMIDSAEKSVKLSQQDLVSMKLPKKEYNLGLGKVEIDLEKYSAKLPKKEYDLSLKVEIDPEKYSATKQHLSSELLDHLGKAMIDRKVKVEVALSTNDESGYQHGWSIDKTRDEILKHVEAMAKRRSPAEIEEIKKRLDVRGVYTRDGATVRNHSKTILIDDSAFYVGSQNLYPGGMADRGAFDAYAQLAEFGYIVDDKSKAEELKQRYWDPLWSRSK